MPDRDAPPPRRAWLAALRRGLAGLAAPPPPTPAPDAAPPVAVAVAPSAAHPQGLTSETRAMMEQLTGIGTFAEIMQRHLDNVCAETERASMDILRRILDVEQIAHAMTHYVETMVTSEAFATSGERVVVSIADGRQLIRELADARGQTGIDIAVQLDIAKNLSSQMQSYIGEIERIHRYTDVLSMNASIRVASLADAGGLDVVANEIRGLAGRTGELASGLRTELGRMNDMLQNGIIDRLAAQIDRAEMLHERFETLSLHILTLNEMQNGLLDTVRREGAAMREPLMQLSGSIQFQDVARQQLEQVGSGMTLISAHIVAMGQAMLGERPLPETTVEECLAAISGKYVMERQRDAHRGEPEAPESTALAIELF